MVTDVCIHIPEHTNYCELEPEDARYCMVVLLQQHGLGLVHTHSLEFLTFEHLIFNYESEDDEQLCWTYEPLLLPNM
jgi:hypothetical protein